MANDLIMLGVILGPLTVGVLIELAGTQSVPIYLPQERPDDR